MLSRLATPSTCLRAQANPSRALSTSIAMRFKNSAAFAADSSPPKPRQNPLVGNIQRSKPTTFEQAPVSTEHPQATQPPRPDKAPRSSAEVPPNQDMPLPPPPPPQSSSNEGIFSLGNANKTTHPYTAAGSAAGATPFNLDIASIVANKSAAYGAAVSTDPQSRPNVRCKAVTGRTVMVSERTSATTGNSPLNALSVLNRMLKRDKVKTKWHGQRFHERPGLRRKRQKSQRWRRRFKDGFKATVTRVLELKKQGW